MKKLLIILGILSVLTVAAAAAFILTFDPAQYAPLIEQKLEQELDSEISFDDIRLSWGGGLGLEVKNLLIADHQRADQDLPIRIEKIKLLLKLTPLLRRSFQIGSVELVSPEIHATQTQDGKFFIGGLRSLFEKESPDAGNSSITLLIETLKIKEADFFYHDLKGADPVHIQLKNLTGNVKNFSLFNPLRFTLAGSLFGESNLKIKGEIQLPRGGQPANLTDGELEYDLSKINLDELRTSIPSLTSLPVTRITGNLIVSIPSVSLSSDISQNISASLHLDSEHTEIEGLPKPIKNTSARISLKNELLTVQELRFLFGSGSVEALGEIRNWNKQPLPTFEIKANNIIPEELIEHDASSPYLKGVLSLNFKGGSTAPTMGQFIDFLYGEGFLKLDQGMLVNVNVMQAIFKKISIIPGLMNKLQQSLTVENQERLNAPNTELAPIEQKFNVQNRMLYAEQIQLRTADYVIFGTFQYQFDNLLRGQASFEISPEISAAFIQSVKELGYLANQEGSIQIPVNIYGKAPQISIFPDLQYIGSKLAVVTAQEFIGNLLQKKTDTSSPPAPEQTGESQNTAPPQTSQQGSLGGLLAGFLQPATTPTTNTHTNAQTAPTTSEPVKRKAPSLLSELLSSTLQQQQSGTSGQNNQ